MQNWRSVQFQTNPSGRSQDATHQATLDLACSARNVDDASYREHARSIRSSHWPATKRHILRVHPSIRKRGASPSDLEPARQPGNYAGRKERRPASAGRRFDAGKILSLRTSTAPIARIRVDGVHSALAGRPFATGLADRSQRARNDIRQRGQVRQCGERSRPPNSLGAARRLQRHATLFNQS